MNDDSLMDDWSDYQDEAGREDKLLTEMRAYDEQRTYYND